MSSIDPPPRRFVALDVSKQTVVVAAVDQSQQLLLQPKRLKNFEFEGWAAQHLQPEDVVVLEATGNCWYWYDLLQPRVSKVIVAQPRTIKLISAGRVKTDPRDAIHLARLLAANLIPQVWVPPQPVRELRSLVAHRQGLVRQRTQGRNRLHAILMSHNIVPEVTEPFSVSQRNWWENLALASLEKLLIRQQLSQLDQLEQLIAEAEAEVSRLSRLEPWAGEVTYLVQLPGIGVFTAMVILSAIGDISRFASAKKLVGYSGLGASIYASGQLVRNGGITKQGRKELRHVMVEAAWVAVEKSAYWKSQFERLAARKGKAKAIVAIARKLLVVVWQVLTQKRADQQADETKVALKLLKWAYKLKAQGRGGLRVADFIRQELDRLGLGQNLLEVYRGKKRYPISPQPSEAKRGWVAS